MADRTHRDYVIVSGEKLDIVDILRQLDSVVEFPAILLMYNRVFQIANKEELWALRTGLEISWDLVLDKWEMGALTPKRVPVITATEPLACGAVEATL